MIIYYPSYSFETLASDRTETEARELLAAWTAAFHPALIEKCDEIPRWESASNPSYDPDKRVVLVPPCCETFLSEEWFEQQREAGIRFVRHLKKREEIVARLLEEHEIEGYDFDAAYVDDFSALAAVYFLVDLLVRQLHYMSAQDDTQLRSLLLRSLESYRKNERDSADDYLRQAFETVSQSKEYFYPIQTYLLDLLLVTPGTTGAALQNLLQKRDRMNLFLPSTLLERIAENEPETLAALKTASEENRVRFIVDDTEQKSLLLLPLLDQVDRILEGLSIYRERLNVSPTVYGRLHAGLSPLLPQLLKLTGMKGAVHFAPLDGWHLKGPAQSKMIWKGVDGTTLDALIRYPLNTTASLDFFALAGQLGETINNDHAPTALLAHFPLKPEAIPENGGTNWLEALRRNAEFSSTLGDLTLIDDYFASTPQCGNVDSPGFAKYPAYSLADVLNAETPDPLSAWNPIHRGAVRRSIDSAFGLCLTLLGREPAEEGVSRQFAAMIAGDGPNDAGKTPVGLLLLNPWSFPRRAFVELPPEAALPEESKTVVLALESEGRKEIVVDIPPVGYAFVELPKTKIASKIEVVAEKSDEKSGGFLGFFKRPAVKPAPGMVRKEDEEYGKNARRTVYRLQNEFFDVKFDATTGMLRSVFTDNSRFNRLSRQLGYRMPKERRREDTRGAADPNFGYAIMAADEISILSQGPVSGRLRIQGRLVCPDGTPAARYTETVTIRRRSRMLLFDLELEPLVEPGRQPWDSYFGIRYAWNDNTLDVRGGLGDGVYELSGDLLQSPRFVDLRSPKHSLTFFSEGMPFHRRFGERQLDSLLVIPGESVRRFRLGLGVDLRYPVPASLEFLADGDDLAVPVCHCPKNPSSWLFQVEAKNVVALHWEPIYDGEEGSNPVGFQVFLLETEGRRARFALQSFLAPLRAAATNFLGEELKELDIESGAVQVDMHARQLLPLTVRVR